MKNKTYSTRGSQLIPHVGTNRARSDLASQFGMGWGACQLGMAVCADCPHTPTIYTRRFHTENAN